MAFIVTEGSLVPSSTSNTRGEEQERNLPLFPPKENLQKKIEGRSAEKAIVPLVSFVTEGGLF
jgi:hypothetical protein